VAQPLYYLPGVSRKALAPDGNLVRSILGSRGIGDTFRDVIGIAADCGITDVTGTGPDGGSGCILCYQTLDGSLPESTGFDPDKQTWTEAEGVDGGLWLGLTNDSPPTPEDMRRKKQIGGYSFPLGDGQTWTVPVLRRPDDSTELPTGMVIQPDGSIDEPVKAAYRQLWEDAGKIVGYFYTDTNPDRQLDRPTAMSLAMRALGLNYRFGTHEQNLLQLLDSESFLAVVGMMVDTPKCLTIEEAEQKKTES
jgi:hypothetical protein